MSYSIEHKQKVRLKILESARILFNRHGFDDVTIDRVMKFAGLTRGGFYNHFPSKEILFKEAVSSFLMGRGAKWREEAGIDPSNLNPNMASQMVQSYLSNEHLGDVDGQCPMIALPSDIARASPEVQSSYQELLKAMVSLFENSQKNLTSDARKNALSVSALCVGGMILARTLPNSALANEVQLAAKDAAEQIIQG